jgi:hypothetical protein
MVAKYYIYRNLHTKTFSVRYKGKVIAHPKLFTAYGVTFKVNQTGRQKVLNERRKNVHAFVVCDHWEETLKGKRITNRVFYNPYEGDSFVDRNFSPIFTTKIALGAFGRMIFIGERITNGYDKTR